MIKPVFKRIIIPILLLISVTVAMLRPSTLSDEEQIQQHIENIASAIEHKNLSDVLDHISPNYRDENGLKKMQLKGLVFRQFQQHKSISVILSPIGVVATPPTGRAEFDAAILTGGSSIPGLPSNGEFMHFSVDFEKNGDDEWRITNHRRDIALSED